MKLQEAFVSEANAIGDWTRIGYKMDDTPNFDYEPVTDAANDGTTMLTDVAATAYWQATNKVAMNDCGMTGGTGACSWTITLAANTTGNGIKATATAPADGKMLTPSFEMIGK